MSDHQTINVHTTLSTHSHHKTHFLKRLRKNLAQEGSSTLREITFVFKIILISLIGFFIFFFGYIQSLRPPKPPKVPSLYFPPLTVFVIGTIIVTGVLAFSLQV